MAFRKFTNAEKFVPLTKEELEEQNTAKVLQQHKAAKTPSKN